MAEGPHAASADGEKAHPGGHPMEPEPSRSLLMTPKDPSQWGSASARRALFARRRREASHSPNTPPPPPSPPRCHVSTPPPVGGLSPLTVQSQASDSSLADTSAQHQPCLHPRDRPSAAGLVSHLVTERSVTAFVSMLV